MLNFVRFLILPILFVSTPALADESPEDFYVKKGVTLLSGDAWVQDKIKYQLFGVQSCLRGTFFINVKNTKVDCGEASMKILASFFNDVATICRPMLSSDNTVFVDCKIQVKNEIVDLGTALVSVGFHFSAIDFKDNTPLNITYDAAEKLAFKAKVGLWAFDTFPHPVEILKKQGTQSE